MNLIIRLAHCIVPLHIDYKAVVLLSMSLTGEGEPAVVVRSLTDHTPKRHDPNDTERAKEQDTQMCEFDIKVLVITPNSYSRVHWSLSSERY